MKPNHDKKINFYQRIFSAIQATNKLPPDLTPQRARYYTKPLVDSKLIEYKGSGATGAWFLTETFKRLERQGMIKKSNLIALAKPNYCTRVANIRGHGFGMRLKIPRLANWHNRYSVMKEHGYKPKLLKTGATQIILKGNKTHLCDRSIVMYYDSDYSYIANSAVESLTRATNDFLKHIEALESKFKISFKINGRYRFKCFKHHFGHLDNVIAKKCKIEGKSYTLYRDNGKPWLEIDFSNKRFVETETIDAETGLYDMDAKIKPLFDEVDKNPHFISEMKERQVVMERTVFNQAEMLKATQEQLRATAYQNAELTKNITDLVNYIKEKEHR